MDRPRPDHPGTINHAAGDGGDSFPDLDPTVDVVTIGNLRELATLRSLATLHILAALIDCRQCALAGVEKPAACSTAADVDFDWFHALGTTPLIAHGRVIAINTSVGPTAIKADSQEGT